VIGEFNSKSPRQLQLRDPLQRLNATTRDLNGKLVVLSDNVAILIDEQRLTGLGREKKDALEELSPGSFSGKHETFVEARVENTGQWLLRTNEFQEWITMKGDPLLFCPGICKRSYAMLLTYKVEQESRL
jgi:hypothetical protein